VSSLAERDSDPTLTECTEKSKSKGCRCAWCMKITGCEKAPCADRCPDKTQNPVQDDDTCEEISKNREPLLKKAS